MDFALIVQLAMFGILALAGLIIVGGALKAVTRSKKIKSYRYSKKGDGWIVDYKKS